MSCDREQAADSILSPAGRFAVAVLTHRRSRVKPLTRPPLRQGTDPADAIYREQVRRDCERAHAYLASQVKKS